MKCPQCSGQTKPFKVGSIVVDRCHECGGTWYGKDELRLLKDRERDEDYRWIDVDLWKDPDRFITGEQHHYECPVDGKRMLTVHYGDSPVRADICEHCHGIFLQKGAYQEILAFLEKKVDTETVRDYAADLKDEFVEIFTGPEGVASELSDFAKVLHLLQLRFVVQHTNLAEALRSAARGFPGA
jgi:Zn-finger nucleic acid-binding protein